MNTSENKYLHWGCNAMIIILMILLSLELIGMFVQLGEEKQSSGGRYWDDYILKNDLDEERYYELVSKAYDNTNSLRNQEELSDYEVIALYAESEFLYEAFLQNGLDVSELQSFKDRALEQVTSSDRLHFDMINQMVMERINMPINGMGSNE